jgi:hypothetical protein
VTSSDLQGLLDQLTPATIPLGERGHLYFDAPAEVSLVADRGLAVRCHAKLAWPVLGIDVAITIRSMTILVVPSIESRDGEQLVVFSPEVDALDLALLPDIGDDEVRAFINRALQEKRIELPWNYRETLGHQFPLPEWFRPNAAFGIRPNGAAVKVTNDTMGLAIGIHAGVEPQAREHGNGVSNGKDGHRAVANGIDHHGAPSNGVYNGEERADDARAQDAFLDEGWSGPAPSRKRTGALAIRRKRTRLAALGAAVLGGFGVGCLVGLWGTNRG